MILPPGSSRRTYPDPGDGQSIRQSSGSPAETATRSTDSGKGAPRDNDQTAAAYRKAGIVLMFPSLRGGNDNPGHREGFLGEVEDVLAATEYLARQEYVDPTGALSGGT